MSSPFDSRISKVKTALENIFVKKSDIKDNLTSTDTNKPLSAKQGKQLNDNKASITHTHGNLTNDGKLGSTAKLPVVTGTNGVVTTGNTGFAYGQVDSTSTSTVFTATVDGITSLTDGTTVMLRNGYVTSAEGFTLEVNGLGAKPVYNSMANATRDTTIFNINYTMLFVYDSTRVEGGCWICYRGYNSDKDTNTIGYQLRTNSTVFTTTDKGYRYRLWLECADGKVMPVNTSTSTNATAKRDTAMNTRDFYLGGRIFYYSVKADTNANTGLTATSMWQQYLVTLGYSFNNTGSALVLTLNTPVYMVAENRGNGMGRLTSPYYTQTLPNTADNKLYIYLGHATTETQIELALQHPIYEYKNNSIRLYRDYYTTGEVDTLLGGKSDTGHTHTVSNITDFPNLSNVATSGNYNDLDNKPSIDNTVTENSANAVKSSGIYTALTGKADTNHTHSGYASSTHSHGNISNTGIMTSKDGVTNKNVVTDSNGKIIVEDKPSIPSKTSDLTNDSNFISTSSTTGLIKNDGSIDTSSYITSSAITNHNSSSSAHSSLFNGKADSVHTHSTLDITDFPAIPSDLEDLTDDTGILHFNDYIAYDDMSGVPLSDFNNDITKLEGASSGYTIIQEDEENGTQSAFNEKLIYDYGDTNELHFIKTNGDDVNFDDIILEGDSRLTNARTPTSHSHSKEDIDFQTTTSSFNIHLYETTEYMINKHEFAIPSGEEAEFDFSSILLNDGDYVSFKITGNGYGSVVTEYNHAQFNFTNGVPTIKAERTEGTLQTTIYNANGGVVNTEINSALIKIYCSTGALSGYFSSKTYSRKATWLDMIHPIGSIYISTQNRNPSLYFGGEWEQIEDRFLLASGTNYSIGTTGGEATHSLTESEMPRHTHIQNSHNHTQNPHHHDTNRKWSTGTGSDSAYAQASSRSYQSIQTKDTTATNNAQTATNQYTGGSGTAQSESNGVAHNNMPPYLVVNIWKRVS